MLKIGLIKEGKTPPDERVPYTPIQCSDIKSNYSAEVLVEKSTVRRIPDQQYSASGIELTDDPAQCDVLFGVKEVPIKDLVANKTYFFFSHTIKEQPYNRDLLKAILDKNIRLIDYECLVNDRNARLLGFGRFAGLVGAYNGFRMIGEKQGTYSLKKAVECSDLQEMLKELEKVNTGTLKICLTGRGRVAGGAIEILKALNIRQVDVDQYLGEDFDESVFVQLAVTDYNKRKDGKEGSIQEFFQDPTPYQSDFRRFSEKTDFYIACHYWDSKAPFLYTREDLASPDFAISYVADISCDIDGPVASTIRPSTIEQPFYGIDKNSANEVDLMQEDSLSVMAVDNLPCELPIDASEDFGRQLMEHVIPYLFDNDSKQVLKRATIAENGKLTERYAYLQDYVNG